MTAPSDTALLPTRLSERAQNPRVLRLNPADNIVVARFHPLCGFLDRNRDSFRVSGFKGLSPRVGELRSDALASPIWKTGARMLEQAYRRTYR